jgi:hypothetical protein
MVAVRKHNLLLGRSTNQKQWGQFLSCLNSLLITCDVAIADR